MYPHERSLVSKLKGKPFALIGVNSDSDREFAREAVRKNKLNWRSFWNGPKGTSGPISARWNVIGWPRIYLIDHEGVIRHRGLQGDALDRAIDALITAIPEGR